MTRKEKAKEMYQVLVDYDIDDCNGHLEINKENTKANCDYMLQQIFELEVKWNDAKMVNDYSKVFPLESTYEFWDEVKQEIEKL